MGFKPIAPKAHPLLNQLVSHIDASEMTRYEVWQKAGYSYWSARQLARSEFSPRLFTFVDLCHAAGLDVVLVPKKKGAIRAENNLRPQTNTCTT